MICGKSLAASFAALAFGLAGVPAQADPRLVSHLYNENEVVRIDGKLGVQATVGFAADEQIENVAVGDSRTWQITPNKRANLLFVKPLESGARTNMTVVTNKRTYFFDLVASPRAKPLYMLRFSYKDEDKAPGKSSRPGGASLTGDERAALSGDPGAAPADPAVLNFAWSRKGDAELLPTRVYDDGQATYLLWNKKQSLPAILVRNEDGVEGPVNYAVRGSTIVIDEVPPLIVLRTGKAKATLENMRGNASANVVLPPGVKLRSPRFTAAFDLPAHSSIWRD